MGDNPRTALACSVRKKVLVLYDHHWVRVKTHADYLTSFRRFSESDVSYATSFGRCHFDLDYFDVVVIHYSVKVCYPGFLSASYQRALRQARCLKVLFLQDEYESTAANQAAILDLGISLVFTCVPIESIAKVYPPDRFPGVRFVNVLTGYVPLDLLSAVEPRPMRERSVLIGYRGRRIGYWYGNLGREKLVIGQRMKALCEERELTTDIAWEEEDRIYGDDWLRFLASCKATLGTESGANVFDFDGTLTRKIEFALMQQPDLTYEEIHERYLRQREGAIVMNQISPKIFEAIACRTALILFEGRYSGVLEADRHFIPLRKDFSNVEEVLQRLRDDDYLEQLTQRAYDDVIAGGRYSYASFVQQFDEVLREQTASGRYPVPPPSPWLPPPPCDALAGFRSSYARAFRTPLLRTMWNALPPWLRGALRPVFSLHRWKLRWTNLKRKQRS